MSITYFGGASVPLITQKISDVEVASAIICTGQVTYDQG